MSRFNIFSWSLPVKFFVFLALAAIFPFLLGVTVIGNGVQELSLRYLQDYVREAGTISKQNIENDLEHAAEDVERLGQSILRFEGSSDLLSGTSDNSDVLAPIEAFIRMEFLEHETENVNAVWILNLEGQVVLNIAGADAALPFVEFDEVDRDGGQSTSLAYRVGETLLERAQEQGVDVTTRGGETRLEVVHVLRQPDTGDPLAFLVADLNTHHIILDNLASASDASQFSERQGILLHSSDAVFADEAILENEQVSLNSIGVQRAKLFREGTETYFSGARNSIEVTGFYSPLEFLGSDFVFVMEAPTESVRQFTFESLRISTATFVLGIIFFCRRFDMAPQSVGHTRS